MKFKYLLIISFSFTLASALAQPKNELTLDSCYVLAKNNYPLIKQLELIEKTKDYSLSNVSKGFLPQLNLGGQATHQSEVTGLPISIPGMNIPVISKDQYRIFGELNQPLTDLITVKEQKEMVKANANVEYQKIEVELFKLKDRVNQLFFGILMVDAQINQTNLFKTDLESALNKMNAAVKNGIALKSNTYILQAEMLKLNQKITELQYMRSGLTQMLSLLIGKNIGNNNKLIQPYLITTNTTLNRPEISLFDLQQKSLDIQSKLITAKNLPRFNLFFQGGFGRPALNMLSNDLREYYIGGVRLNWSLSGFYTYNKEKKIVSLTKNAINTQKETFVFNTHIALKQQDAEVEKLESLISTDSEIITLRENIKLTAKKQLEFGTVTANDYVLLANAEDLAKQNLVLHQVQLLMAKYQQQHTTGN